MKKNVLMVVNPISGDVDKSAMVDAAQFFAEKEKYSFIRYETTGNNDCDQIKSLYQQHHPQRVLIAGGDGTIKMVAEALEEQDVIFGILPAGSANGLSVDLNLTNNLEENLEVAFGKQFMEMDMVCINNKKSLHLSDLGLNAQLVKNYENSETRGMLGYALQAINTLQEQDPPFMVTVEADNRKLECEARMVVVANSQKYGTGVTINPNGLMNDGKFEIILLKNLDVIVFGKIITGNMPLDTGDVEILTAEKATITTNVPVHFQIDGEYVGEETHLDIHILHRQMKVAVP
ncbi:diacylglycerol/lipid kinase family protein [Flavobacterium sp.]|uniref:diacylglycerol/lipid kinase family protein n=1 Tax=Flavobacterium sp. TaxID=239 RepID=UPI0039E50640